MKIVRLTKSALRSLSDRLLLFRYRNRPYMEYYRVVMQRRARRDPKEAVGGRWELGSAGQIALLKRYGIEPRHTVLDIGCGSLRGGLNVIAYLDVGNYTGVDISEEILAAGRTFLSEAGLADKKPLLLHTDNLAFKEVEGHTYDYLLAISVLTHMPPEDIDMLFSNLHKVMHEKSVFLATVFLSKTNAMYSTVMRRNFFYPIDWLQTAGDRHGLMIERDRSGDAKQNLLKITRKQLLA